MAQTKVIKIGRVVDKWMRLLTYLQSGSPAVYRLTFPSTEMAKKAAHSFKELADRNGHIHMVAIHRGDVCYVFKSTMVQDVQIVDE